MVATFPHASLVSGDVPNLSELILSSKNCRTSLPQCKNEHLEILGSSCPQLTFLDVSYVRTLTVEGLRFLAPDPHLGRAGERHFFTCSDFISETSLNKFSIKL